jgi:2-aminoadipate transaminase
MAAMTERRGGASNARPPTIDFGEGRPDTPLLPVALLREAAGEALAEAQARRLNYGLERGSLAFREALAAFLARQTGAPTSPERLFVTGGASVALDLLCTRFTSPGDSVLVVEPTYHLALRTLRDHGLRVVGVASDGGQVDLDLLDALLERHRPAFLYLVPSYANPTSMSLPAGQGEVLLERCAAHSTLVVADDVYALLPFGGVPRRFGEAEPHLLTLGSFSKVLAPALRLGWIEGAPEVLDRFEASGLVQSGGGLAPLAESLTLPLLRSHALDAHLVELRRSLRARAEALGAALRDALPGSSFATPRGGYFIWLRLPGVDSAALAAHADAHGVSFLPGHLFGVDADHREYLRLAFSRYDERTLAEGAARLAQAERSLASGRLRTSGHPDTEVK